jgi:hypothetical protein
MFRPSFVYCGDVFVEPKLIPTHEFHNQAYLATFRINATQSPPMSRRPSRAEADARTHPSSNFKLPLRTVTNLADAEPVVADYAARMCDWGLERFPATSGEARFLRAMRALDLLLRAAVDQNDYNQEHWTAVLDLARTAMNLRLEVHAFSLFVEIDGHQLDVNETISCVHTAAVSALLTLFLST